MVDANIIAANAKISGEVFNVAGGNRCTLNQMVEILKNIFDKDNEVFYIDSRPGDVQHSEADVSKIKNKLNSNAKVDFENGLKKTAEWYKTIN